MSLQGNLESFSLSELLQLLSHQGKTGTLEVETGEGQARLRFLEGRLVEAWADRRSPAELIGGMLVRSGLVSPAQLGHALDRQRQSLRRLGDILVRMGILRLGEFRRVLALQHRETVYRLLALRRGPFRFVDEPVEVEEGVSVLLDVGELLMEGFRQIDEWPRIRERIPSDRHVYSRVPGATVPADLDADTLRVLSLVDGVLSAGEVVDRALTGRFRGFEALAELYDLGLIRRVAVARRARAPVRVPRRRRWVDAVAGACLVAAAGALLVFGAQRRPQGTLTPLREAMGAVQAARSEWAHRVEEWMQSRPERWPEIREARRPAGRR